MTGKHSAATLERLLARAEADRAYLQPWISETAERLESIGGWGGIPFAKESEVSVALVGEIALEEVHGTASVLDGVLDPSWCQNLVDKHLKVGFTTQAEVDKLKKEAELRAVGREGVAAALRDAYRLRRELGIQYSFVESGNNTSEVLTVESWELADLLWQRCHPFIPSQLQEPKGSMTLSPGTYHAQCIIPVFRFMRYSAGQGFRPHHDPTRLFRQHPRTKQKGIFCSLVTIALYLNSANEMDGGALSFLHSVAGKKNQKFESFARVEPAAGRAVIFPHKQLHEGGELAGGVKHMCQCDVLYKRVGD